MALSEDRLQELAQRLAKALDTGEGSKQASPALRLVQPAPKTMDSVTRESHCRMIRHMRWRWGKHMQVIIDQACFGVTGIERLDDDALIQLHRDMERAQDCMRDGVSFEDAGLLRSRYG